MIRRRIKYYISVLFFWTALIVSLNIYEFNGIKKDTNELVVNEARASINKDQAIRHWASLHGGIYVPVDSNTQPNPGLAHIPERDIVTPSGVQLTLMNPAYIIRQMNEYSKEYYGMEGHITSKIIIREENKPDDWEILALDKFENGDTEVLGYSEMNGEEYFRLMQPMITKESCLKCHGFQGYKVGDIRGGVSVSLPIKKWLWFKITMFFIIFVKSYKTGINGRYY
ncbi:MAG: DUF3365 domain-containing protein, partial [Bacteroidales bacterium]|nr:DUF3365 domain-containing protein [Bacteroidales bacterium]